MVEGRACALLFFHDKNERVLSVPGGSEGLPGRMVTAL